MNILFKIKKWWFDLHIKELNRAYPDEDNTDAEFIFRKIFGFTNKDYSPKQCLYCGHKEFYRVTKDTLGPLVTEESIKCKRCHKDNGYWSHGTYMP